MMLIQQIVRMRHSFFLLFSDFFIVLPRFIVHFLSDVFAENTLLLPRVGGFQTFW